MVVSFLTIKIKRIVVIRFLLITLFQLGYLFCCFSVIWEIKLLILLFLQPRQTWGQRWSPLVGNTIHTVVGPVICYHSRTRHRSVVETGPDTPPPHRETNREKKKLFMYLISLELLLSKIRHAHALWCVQNKHTYSEDFIRMSAQSRRGRVGFHFGNSQHQWTKLKVMSILTV